MPEIGDILNGYPVLPPHERKTILLLSDDLRMTSGVGNMSREFVMGTLHYYNWVQIGGAIKHPEHGKAVDMNKDVQERTGIPGADLKIHPTNGYGSQDMVRHIMQAYNPSAIMIYTDPRFWEWLFQMEVEIRTKIPILYYNIWDDLPYPMWNRKYYDSVDALFNISKQTCNIVRQVRSSYEDWQVTYIPHGINEHDYFPLDESYEKHKEYSEFRNNVFGGNEYETVFFYNARNIRRKLTSDIMYAFRAFCDSIPKEEAKKCALLMHTQPRDENGTDLFEIATHLLNGHNVIFSHDRLEREQLNWLYNMSDAGVLISSNEGFGLMGAESLMVGNPIIINVSGGMQDYCGFMKEDGTYLTHEDYTLEWGSNHDGRYKDHGEWAFPVWPTSRSIQGSIPTPYISDDRPDWQDVAIQMKKIWSLDKSERKRIGLLGRQFVMDPNIGMTASEMNRRFMQDIDTALEKFKPSGRMDMYNMTTFENKMPDWNGLTITKEI
tara:strand:- start:960 stop:2438 length:1479 start_codon:yes stop_codon:yes gene_type:complete